MGDRAVVFFIHKYKIKGEEKISVSPGVYLHWSGRPERVEEFLTKALPRMRQGDCQYSAARFCGVCHEMIEGNLSLGLFNAPDNLIEMSREEMDERFLCDNGIYLVDVSDWTVTQKGVSNPVSFNLDKNRIPEG